MAYNPDSPPRLKVPCDTGGQVWIFVSSIDSVATIAGAGYITNAKLIGLLVGDLVIVVDSANTTGLYYVSSITGMAANLSKISGSGGGGSGTVVTQTTSTTLTSGNTGNTYSNAGAVAEVDLTLPAAIVGTAFAGYVATNQILQFIAVGTDIISSGADNSVAAGTIGAATTGNFIQMLCMKTGVWSVINMIGDWTIL